MIVTHECICIHIGKLRLSMHVSVCYVCTHAHTHIFKVNITETKSIHEIAELVLVIGH